MQEALRHILVSISNLGPLAPLIILLFYAAATTLFIPISLLAFGAGALFGVPAGLLITATASLCSAAFSFSCGRRRAGEWAARRILSQRKFDAIRRVIAQGGWKTVFFLRLSAFLPFTVINLTLGMSGIRFKDYILATAAGILPGLFLYTYIGALAENAASQESFDSPVKILGLAGIAVTLGLFFYAARAFRKALHLSDSLPTGPTPAAR